MFDRNAASTKLQQIVDQRRSSVDAVLETIEREQPVDALVPYAAMKFGTTSGTESKAITLAHPGGDFGIHEHALVQIAERVKLPMDYVGRLRTNGFEDLVADNLNYLYRRLTGRGLLRAVNGTVRGSMSDSYRRRDSRPLADAIVRMANELGAVPIDARRTDVRTSLRVVRPQVVEIDGDFVVIGLSWNNSDYGSGANVLASFILRLICINGAVAEKILREIHLGARLDDAAFSEHTYKLDQATAVSATRDMVRLALSDDAVEKLVNKVRAAKAATIDPEKAVLNLRKVATKAEAEEITKLYTSADIEMLPAGNNAWRWSNAISRFANTVTDAGHAMELDSLAGSVLTKAA